MSGDYGSFFTSGQRTRLEVRGLKKTQKRMEETARDLTGKPMMNAMRQATLIVQRDAKKFAPVDTGRLRASITPDVRVMTNTVEGVVGSNVKYAPYMELGTRPHWPPISALEVWARRHGIEAFLVARAIAQRGTRPRRFLQKAFEKNVNRIERLLGNVVAKIVEKE
jgi:HK97 gp10 family phage protein